MSAKCRASQNQPAIVYVSHHSDSSTKRTAARCQDLTLGSDVVLRALALGMRHVASKPSPPDAIRQERQEDSTGWQQEQDGEGPGSDLGQENFSSPLQRHTMTCSGDCEVPAALYVTGEGEGASNARSEEVKSGGDLDVHQIFLEVERCKLVLTSGEEVSQHRDPCTATGYVSLDVKRAVLQIAPHLSVNMIKVHPIEVHGQYLLDGRRALERPSSWAISPQSTPGSCLEGTAFMAENVTVKVSPLPRSLCRSGCF